MFTLIKGMAAVSFVGACRFRGSDDEDFVPRVPPEDSGVHVKDGGYDAPVDHAEDDASSETPSDGGDLDANIGDGDAYFEDANTEDADFEDAYFNDANAEDGGLSDAEGASDAF